MASGSLRNADENRLKNITGGAFTQALFGIKDGPEAGCRHALAAVRTIVQEVSRLSNDLALDPKLRGLE